MADYLNFDLLVERIHASYQARVVHSPSGEAVATFAFPFTEEELATVTAASWSGMTDASADFTPRQIGERLFTALFRGDVRLCLERSLAAATGPGRPGLRLRLRLGDAPELACLPWEYLHGPSPYSFFATSSQTPIVRYLELAQPIEALAVKHPLHILVVIANPTDVMPQLAVEQEWQHLQDAMSSLTARGLIVLERLRTATLTTLQQRLRQPNVPVHILHFIGHGFFDEQQQMASLLLETRDGRANPIVADAFSTLLHDHPSLRLVFLNACEGARAAENDLFTGLAQTLVQRGLAAAIAMQFAVSDVAAIELTSEFYRAIGDGYAVDSALAEARKALYIRNNQVEWGTPVLFMRAPTGRLFDISGVAESGGGVGDSPYKGLQYFDINDAERFFGREELTAELINHLRQHTLLAIVGASGSGKSSLVRAGLIPALKRDIVLADGSPPIIGSQTWPLYVITPTAHPLESLASALTWESDSVRATATLIDDLREDARSLHLYVRKLLNRSSAGGQSAPKHLLLFIDQFEELFTLCRDREQRRAFVDNLLTAAVPSMTGNGGGPTIVIITLRADFYAHCAEFENLRQALERHQRFIGAMNAQELRRAIEQPARQEGWEIEPGLVDVLLDDIGEEPGALPLLSHALLETWKRRQGRLLTFAGYAASGRVQGAIAQTAETVFKQRLTADQQQIAKNIFLRLTELGEGAQDTRRRVPLQELIVPDQDKSIVDIVIKMLADARLITTSEGIAEVAHEALIREWPTLREWLTDNREGLRVHRQLTESAEEWAVLDYDAGALYRGLRLQQAIAWVSENAVVLNVLERKFLEASRTAADYAEQEKEAARQHDLEQARALAEAQREHAEGQARAATNLRRRNKLLRLVSGIALLFAIAAVGFAIQSNGNYRVAAVNEQSAKANAKRADAEADSARNAKDQAQAAAAAAQASTTIAEREKRMAIASHLAAQSQLKAQTQQERASSTPLLLAREAIFTTWITDSTTITQPLIVTQADTALRLALATAPPWRMTLPRHYHTGPIWSAVFSHDGTLLLTASEDSTARIWDVKTGEQLFYLKESPEELARATFSPDEKLIITVSTDNTDGVVRVWDRSSGHEVHWIAQAPSKALSALFSPNGQWILTAHADGVARIFDFKTGQAIRLLQGHTNTIRWAEFSPNGKEVVTGSRDHTIRLWNAESGDELRKFTGHTDGVQMAIFSPDGQTIASASLDNSVRLWDITTGAEIGQFQAKNARFRTLAFSPNGQIIVAVGTDRAAHVLDAKTLAEKVTFKGHRAGVSGVTISLDGSTIATSDSNATIYLWEAATGKNKYVIDGHTSSVTSVAVSQNGQVVATGSSDNTAHLWNAETGTEIHVLATEDTVRTVAFSPDDRLLATAGDDAVVRLWQVATGTEIRAFTVYTNPIHSVAFSPDGQTLVSGGGDAIVRLWDVASGQEVRQFSGHTAAVNTVMFNPLGSRIVTASADGSVRLWDTNSGRVIHTFQIENSEAVTVTAAAFNPTGTLIASTDTAGVTHLWDVISYRELRQFQDHAGATTAVQFSHDGTHLVTTGVDTTAHIWDLKTAKQIQQLDGHSQEVLAAVFSFDDKTVFTASADHTVRLWDMPTNPRVEVLTGHTSDVNWAAFSPNGNIIATVSPDLSVRLWNRATGSLIHRMEGHTAEINFVDFSPDGQTVITAADDQSIRRWNVKTGDEIQPPIEGQTEAVLMAAFSPDGRMIVSASADKTIRLWEATQGKLLQTMEGHEKAVNAALFSPDGKRIVSASEDGTVRIWDVSRAQVERIINGHTGPVIFASFSPDSRFVASASEDKSMRLWDATSGVEVRQFQHTDAVQSAIFSPDGKYLVTANENNPIIVWDVATGQIVRNIDAHTRETNSAVFSPDGKFILSTSDDQTARLWVADMATLLSQADALLQREPPLLSSRERRRLGLVE